MSTHASGLGGGRDVVMIVTGLPAAGKTTVSRRLADAESKSAHVESGYFFGCTRSGFIPPLSQEDTHTKRPSNGHHSRYCGGIRTSRICRIPGWNRRALVLGTDRQPTQRGRITGALSGVTPNVTSGNRTGSSSGRRSQALRHADNVRPIFHTSPSRKTYAGRPRNNRRACLPVQIRAGTRRPAPLNRSRGSNKLSWEHGKTRPVTSPPDALRSVPKKAERSGVGQPESSLSSAALQVPLPARRHYKSPYPQGGTTSPPHTPMRSCLHIYTNYGTTGSCFPGEVCQGT